MGGGAGPQSPNGRYGPVYTYIYRYSFESIDIIQ